MREGSDPRAGDRDALLTAARVPAAAHIRPAAHRATFRAAAVTAAVAFALARQVRAAGMKIYLDIMYSDFWADPTKQYIPSAWQGQDLAHCRS